MPRSPCARRDAGRVVLVAVTAIAAIGSLVSCGRPAPPADRADAAAATTGAPDSALDPGPTSPAPSVDPGSLPQDRREPGTDGPMFHDGVQALWDGIAADDPDRALAFFFPLSAYRQVKAVRDPAADWQQRLVATFRRDVHRMHAALGSDPAAATLIGLDVPAGRATWVEPGQEVNLVGYWRVYGSVLRYRVGGTERALPIYSLISWRGEWYLVHVNHP